MDIEGFLYVFLRYLKLWLMFGNVIYYVLKIIYKNFFILDIFNFIGSDYV